MAHLRRLAASRRLALVALLALGAPGAARADSLRCEGGLVSTGDSKLDLLGKCGQPALVEERTDEHAWVSLDRRGRGVDARRSAVTVERWTYDFGPRQFVQHVTLEFGQVVAVAHGGYGYGLPAARDAAAPLPRARCDQLSLHEGDSTFDLLARCGEPAVRDVKVVTVSSATEGPGGGSVETTSRTSTVERWTYDFGPQVLVRCATIRDGRVSRVDTGGYGYSSAAAR